MRILFVIENYIPHIGGVEVVFRNLSEGLVKRGHAVDIVTHRMKGAKKFEVINGVRVHRVDCFHSRYAFSFFSIPKAMALARKADIIHTTSFNGAPPAWLVSRIFRKPCIITVHEVWVGLWDKLTEKNPFSIFMHDLLERLIYWLPFNKYVSVSKSTQRQLLNIGIRESRTKVIYNAMDYELFNPEKYSREKQRKKLGLKNEFAYLVYGRPGPSKGIEYAVMAVPEISKAIPDSKMVLILSKDKAYINGYKKIMSLIKKLKIRDKIILLEPVPYRELPGIIKAADCVVVPSLSEGFGYTVAEAGAMEKPVVATNINSIPEVVSGKYVLVKPKSPGAIAEGVHKVFRKKYSRTKKKVFSLQQNISNYLKVYSELLARQL